MEDTKQDTVDQDPVTETAIRAKMDELREHSFVGCSDAKLRQGAKVALGVK